MSNIKLIDGIFINLDGVGLIEANNTIGCSEGQYKLSFTMLVSNSEESLYALGKFIYGTENEAEARIHQILKDQNSDKIGI